MFEEELQQVLQENQNNSGYSGGAPMSKEQQQIEKWNREFLEFAVEDKGLRPGQHP